jgi:glycosidase
MLKLKNLILISLTLTLLACQPTVKPLVIPAHVPAWTKNSVIYEVNIRQYTTEGTFKAFESHLPRLKELGVDILWLMPIHPISEKKRKGSLGSYYSVRDYEGINPEFGTMADFKELVAKAHKLGFKVIIDWVANHTGWDNQWITEHPDWYTHDGKGNIIPPNPDWTDIADLNFDSKPMRRTMINSMRFWIREANIDGFRCDVAWGVPQDFWEAATASLDSVKTVYMLAEDEDHPGFLKKAFVSNYAWKLHHLMNDVARGKKNATDIKKYYTDSVNKYAQGTFPMQFITNHDENSWAGSEYERMGEAIKTFATLTFTLEGIPLIYSGQESGLKKRLLFFEKDTIRWNNLEMHKFYQTLVKLKHSNQALWNGAFGGPSEFLNTSAPGKVLAFVRQKDRSQVLSIFNLSDKPVEVNIQLPQGESYREYFSGKVTTLKKNTNMKLDKWEYRVYVKD